MKYAEIQNLSDAKFKRLTGVPHPIFKQMVAILEKTMSTFGRPPKLSRADQLLLTLMYWRECRTQFHIGQAYGISESAVCRTIQQVENTLIESGQFTLPGKKKLQTSDTLIEVVIVDATEQPIERPQKTKKGTLVARESVIRKKAQVIVNLTTLEIVATAFSEGKKHDFKLFKESGQGIVQTITCLADSDYQSMTKIHKNSQTPKKKSKHHPLTKEEKAGNRALAKARIYGEHVIGKLKIFRILKERYRNRRKRFGLRFNLIASIYNLSLELK